MTKDSFSFNDKRHLAIPDFGNNGMIHSVPSDPLLRSLTVGGYWLMGNKKGTVGILKIEP